MSCLIFAGVNSHGKTIVFGMALLASETAENFIWALTKLDDIHFFINKRKIDPLTIITDEDLGLRNASESVFPKAARQICSWHKQQNFKKKLINITRIPKRASTNQENER